MVEVSPTSPEDDSDMLTPGGNESEPHPGVGGVPVRCTSRPLGCVAPSTDLSIRLGYDVCTAPELLVESLSDRFSQADRTESYTRTTPFQEKQDPSVECVDWRAQPHGPLMHHPSAP